MTELRTQRLILRAWRDRDRGPFADLNADPEVMRHFPSVMSREDSDAWLDRATGQFDDQGWGLWAAEVPGVSPFIGFVGLAMATFPAPFTPALEVGWRLAKEHWGRGYAPEGAAAALGFAFDEVGVNEVVSFTTVGNTNSRRVMEKLGLTRDSSDDFDHPNVAVGSPIRPHVLYRVTKTSYRSSREGAKLAHRAPGWARLVV